MPPSSVTIPFRQIFHRLVPAEKGARLRYLKRPGNFALLEAPQYNDDGLATRHVPIFLSNKKCAESYRLGKRTAALEGLHFDIQWRAHVACWCATQALKFQGDFVECGV